ncbi:MAG: ABC transporter substrate-binding protein [Deltaproteobacteria bacterium]|nr:ABC transporter substrate-binding protein [Deltaproteobacteria bacterium]
MKIAIRLAVVMAVLTPSVSSYAQYTKPVYISLPGPGNIQHLAYAVGKEKKFYDEMGIPNTQIVVLRGNAINVQALVSGTVHFSSAFGPAMQTMFRGEQLRILVQIFNQVPFGLITRPEIKRLEDLKGMKIAVTFGAPLTVCSRRCSPNTACRRISPTTSTSRTMRARCSRCSRGGWLPRLWPRRPISRS